MFGQAAGEASQNPVFNCNFNLLGAEKSLPAHGLYYWDINCEWRLRIASIVQLQRFSLSSNSFIRTLL